MGDCYIVGAAGSRCEFQKEEGDLLIAADGGYRDLLRAGLVPDILLGDFDSLEDASLPQDIPTYRHPVMKDDTDMGLALKLGLEKGYRRFYLYGGAGGRTDHTLANLQLLSSLANRGASGYLVGERNEKGSREVMTVLRNGTCSFPPSARGTVSVFAVGGEAKGVSLSGLLYPLNGVSLSPSFPLGVSNAFTGEEARIAVEDGELLLVWNEE